MDFDLGIRKLKKGTQMALGLIGGVSGICSVITTYLYFVTKNLNWKAFLFPSIGGWIVFFALIVFLKRVGDE